MSNESTEKPVFVDRTDLADRILPYPKWIAQLPTDNIPVIVERTDLADRRSPFPIWSVQLPTDNIPVSVDRTDLADRNLQAEGNKPIKK
jgi:hypothetical protein